MTTTMASLKNWAIGALFAVLVGGSFVAIVVPASVSAGPAAATTSFTCKQAPGFLTFPVWYRGLNVSASDCALTSPDKVGGLGAFIWLIVLNVIEIGLQLVGYIAVGYILYGGFLFLTSTGSSDGMTKARTTIQNAVIGLVISIASVAIVNLIMGVIG